MNYQIFDEMNEGKYIRQDGEVEQDYMERILKAVMEPCQDTDKMCFNNMIEPEFSSCSAADKSLCLRYQPKNWQANPNGVLHGGIIATTMDMTLGVLSRYYVRCSKSVTIQLSISYMNEVSLDRTFCVMAKADKVGKRIKFLSARIIDEKTQNVLAEATSLFM